MLLLGTRYGLRFGQSGRIFRRTESVAGSVDIVEEPYRSRTYSDLLRNVARAIEAWVIDRLESNERWAVGDLMAKNGLLLWLDVKREAAMGKATTSRGRRRANVAQLWLHILQQKSRLGGSKRRHLYF